MPIGEKNQVMKHVNLLTTTGRWIKWSGFFLFVLTPALLLWGCAVTSTQKLHVAGISGSFPEGTIISTRQGGPVSMGELLKDLESCRITYVGEKHTRVADHKIQLQIIQALYQNNPNLVVGMEMFDHSYQDVLDLWSAGNLDETAFLRMVHWYANWRYDFALYRDILNFIKDHHIRLVGLNIPNHIPPKIREGGISSLRDDEKKHLPAEIDTTQAAHRQYVQEVFNRHHQLTGRIDFEDFYAAQTVWEEAMAEAIAKNLKDTNMVVLAGNGHIQFKYGIPDRGFKRTGASFRTIYPASVGREVESNIADYVWVSD